MQSQEKLQFSPLSLIFIGIFSVFFLISCYKYNQPDSINLKGYFRIEEVPIRMGMPWEEIRHLEFHNSSFSEFDFNQLPPMPKLEFLSLGGTSVQTLNFINSKKYPYLISLYLEDTPIQDSSLLNWTDPPTITTLVLRNTKIQTLGWAYKFPKLHDLNIEETKVTSLKGLENCLELRNLWIGWTKIKSLKEIKGQENLYRVGIDNLWIPSHELKEFQKSNPYTKIVRSFLRP